MRVFIQTKENGKFHNDNFFKAYLGFSEMGLEIITFSNNKELCAVILRMLLQVMWEP